MRITVFGLGDAGAESDLPAWRGDGHSVIGVDPNPVKVAFLSQGKSPIVEPGLEPLIAAAIAAGHLTAHSDHTAAVRSR